LTTTLIVQTMFQVSLFHLNFDDFIEFSYALSFEPTFGIMNEQILEIYFKRKPFHRMKHYLKSCTTNICQLILEYHSEVIPVNST
jgi:hypothetical protein